MSLYALLASGVRSRLAVVKALIACKLHIVELVLW